jgi:peptide/nickel transport system substrate-binding protein
LVANRHYHRGAPAHPVLDLVVVRDDNTRALRLEAGAADLALNAVPALLLPLFEGDERFRVTSVPGVGTTYIGLNMEAPALRDVRVRRALAHAIDRPSLVKAKLASRARLASGWVPPGHWAHAADTRLYTYDPAKAEQLLDQAGLRRGDDGVRVRLAIRTGADRAVQSMARALAAMLAKVGVQVEVRPSETATLLSDLGKGRFQLAYMQIPEVFEPHVLSWFFASDRIPVEGKQTGSNRWHLRDPLVDAELERGRSNVARPVRLEAFRNVQLRLAELLPVIPLWLEDVVAVTSRRLSTYDVPRDGRFGTLAY